MYGTRLIFKMTERIHYSGKQDYLKHTFTTGVINKFNTEILDVPVHPYTDIFSIFIDIPVHPYTNIFSIFNEHLLERPGGTVEVLYSGGLDSEAVLIACDKLHIHSVPVTMRLLINNCPINTHDLYYSEKFCREHKFKQRIIDLNVDKFFENGDHIKYLSPYSIIEPHVATHLWLLEQCSEFPVIGGDYCWPWTTQPVISPYRNSYCYYDKFMQDNGITGIGNMLSHSLESNLFFMQAHLSLTRERPELRTDHKNIPIFKQALLNKIGFGELTIRFRSYGWENVSTSLFNKGLYKFQLIKQYGMTTDSISWNDSVTEIIGVGPRSNDKF